VLFTDATVARFNFHKRAIRRARPRHQSRACGTSGSKLGIDATKKILGEGFKRPWPPLIKMDEAVRMKINSLFGNIT